MAYRFTVPGTIFLGENALEEASDVLCTVGKKAFIVTGKSMIKQGNIELLVRILKKKEIDSEVFSEITAEPTDSMVEEGVNLFNEKGCDFIIGFGGGSPLDAAKAISLMSVSKCPISDYCGKIITSKIPPVVEIPSTAGTGSEVTQVTIITDTHRNVKMLLKGPSLMPVLAIVDPAFTLSAPDNVTAATGLDALTHAIESYISKRAFSTTDLYAVSAIKRIFKYLPMAYNDGLNFMAREEMALAAIEAGISFNNSSVTIVHGMSRPVGAIFHVPHGISNAMLLSECLEFVKDGAIDRFAQLGREIGVADFNDSDEEATRKFLYAVDEICCICEIPTLEAYGIDRIKFFESIDKMSKDAFDSGSPSNSRKQVSEEDIKSIYRRLWN